MRANPDEDNYLLESRVRENCMHGSVGGEDVSPSLPNRGLYKMTKNFSVGAGLPAKCPGSGKTAIRGQARSYALPTTHET